MLDGGLDRCERHKWWVSCPVRAWSTTGKRIGGRV